MLKRIRAKRPPAPPYLGCVLASNVIVYVPQAIVILVRGRGTVEVRPSD